MEDRSQKSILDKMKQELDDLELQLKLGSKELKDAYKLRKKKFTELIRDVHEYSMAVKKSGSEKLEEFRKNSKYLLDTLESDFDISYTDYEDKPHDLKKALNDFEKSLKNYFKELGDEAKVSQLKIEKDVKTGIEKFKSDLNVQRAHLKQLNEKSQSDWEEWKEKKLREVNDLKRKIDSKLGESKEKMGKFNEEVSEAFQHLKSAFKNLK